MIFFLVLALFGLLFAAVINAIVLSLAAKIVIGRAATFGSAFAAVVLAFILTLVIGFIVLVFTAVAEFGADQVDGAALMVRLEELAEFELNTNGLVLWAIGLVPISLCTWMLVNTDRTDVRPGLVSSFGISIVSQIIMVVLWIGIGILVGSSYAS